MRRYDIVMISDLRSPGGTSATIAEEIAAQHTAGYSTAVLHVPRLTRRKLRMFNPKVAEVIWEDMADLLHDEEPVRCRLLIVRHPGVFSRIPERLPEIHADAHLMVVNQVPRDTTQPEPFYDVDAVRRNLRALFGEEFAWVPIGPLVRASLRSESPDLRLLPEDWVNTIDVDGWAAERPPLAGRRPVIGRHSRSHYRKWSPDPDELLAAYPDDDSVVVKVLGGIDVPVRTLGYKPGNWVDFPFNSISAKRFCAEIDFFVYFHHPGLIEAFGRAPLEAMASGAVAILPEHFRELFGDAAVYGRPQDVGEIVRALAADQAAYDEQSQRGQAFVRDHFSYEIPAQRAASIIGPPSETASEVPVAKSPIRRPLVLVCLENGRALERACELARARVRGAQPVVLTTTGQAPMARSSGAPVEAVPESGDLLTEGAAQTLLGDRLRGLTARVLPAAVAVVGSAVPSQLLEVSADRRAPLTWIRTAGSDEPIADTITVIDESNPERASDAAAVVMRVLRTALG